MKLDFRSDLDFNLACQKQCLQEYYQEEYDVGWFKTADFVAVVYVDILRKVLPTDQELKPEFFELMAMYLNTDFISKNSGGLAYLFNELGKYDTPIEYLVNECSIEIKGYITGIKEPQIRSLYFLLSLFYASFMNILQFGYLVERNCVEFKNFSELRDLMSDMDIYSKYKDPPFVRFIEELVTDAIPEAITLIFLMLCPGSTQRVNDHLPHEQALEYFQLYYPDLPEIHEIGPFSKLISEDSWSFVRKIRTESFAS